MNNLPLVLSLETATLGGSVWLGQGSKTLATRIGDPMVSHSNSLLTDIHESLEEASVKLQDVDLFACASGPGSFTGLRIGIATVKALAATLGKPCIGIPTLRAVAVGAGPSDATVALLPAGRGEVFAQMFSVSADGKVTEHDAASHLSPQTLLKKYGALKRLRWAGPGLHLQRDAVANYAHEQKITFREEFDEVSVDPSEGRWSLAKEVVNLAEQVAVLASQEFVRGELSSPLSLRANYVRPSDAELKVQCQ